MMITNGVLFQFLIKHTNRLLHKIYNYMLLQLTMFKVMGTKFAYNVSQILTQLHKIDNYTITEGIQNVRLLLQHRLAVVCASH